MKLYIDALGPGGAYRACAEPTELSEDPRTGKPALPRFVEALGYRPVRAGARLFHIERMRYLAGRIIDREVSDGHTLVIVSCTDEVHAAPSTVRALWELTGGAVRRSPASRRSTSRAPAGGTGSRDLRPGCGS